MKLLKEQEILLLSSIIIVILSSCYYAFAGVRFINFFFEKEVTLRTILILSIWPALLFIGFTVAAMGILFFKRWALRLFLILNALIWGNSIKPLFSISYYSILGISNILLLVLSGVSIWFSLKKTTREQFGWSISEREKKFKDFNPKLGYFLATLFILIVCYYALSYFIIYPKQKIVYTQKPNAYFLSHYIKRDICNLTLFLPKDMQIKFLERGNKGYFLLMADPKDTIRISVGFDPLSSYNLFKYLGYRYSYEFHRRLNRFQHFVSANFLRHGKEKMLSSDIGIGNSLEGFLTIFPKKDKQLYEYFIYDRNNREITETISFLSAKNELSYEDINKIISSVELRSVPLKSAEEFFQDGLSSMEKNQYEEAKFSLANALYQNWQNPKYNYYLGNVFLKTNKYLQAKYYLGRSQEYLDAKTLLEHIKKEDSRGSILNSP